MWRRVRAVLLVLQVLVSAWTLEAAPADPEPVVQTQEDFDLGKFMGRWYQVALVSTCPWYLKRRSSDPRVAAMVLQHADSEMNFTKTWSSYRDGVCKQMTSRYSLTDTPGRFFHHVPRFGADVDSFVVRTDYDEYAVMLQLSTGRLSHANSTNIVLYSRTTDLSPAVLEDFKSLVEEHGISADTIIVNQNHGECVPE